MRKQKLKQFRDAVDELLRLRERTHILCNLGVFAGQRTELGNEVRIGQKAHVEDEVGIFGNTITEAKADGRDQHMAVRLFAMKTLLNVSTKLVNVELGGIDDVVSECGNRLNAFTFRENGSLYRGAIAHRVRAASFAEAALQNFVGSLEEQDAGRDTFLDRL